MSETAPVSATTYLKSQAQPNGGWEWSPGWGADTNTTALALQALIAAGEPISSSTVASALAFLETAQNEDGGFAYDLSPHAPSDANSTSYVVQALSAAEEDPLSARWTVSATTPISYLLSLQLPDGSFEWQPGTGANQLATQQVIPALLGRTQPAVSAPLQACPAVYLPQVANQ
jgi:squalene cyclase